MLPTDQKFKDEVAKASQNRFGHPFTPEEAVAHARALRVIMASDGVSSIEAKKFRQVMESSGTPEEIIKEAESHDDSNVKVTDLIKVEPGSRKARELLRGGIYLAYADGFSEEEHRATHQLAFELGISPRVVDVLEASVQLEMAASHLNNKKLSDLVAQLRHAVYEL
jgi:tellurite resistance protein